MNLNLKFYFFFFLIFLVLTNGASPNPHVFRLSLSIFLALVSYFKDYLKHEIGVTYSKIFLFILESPNSTLQQKWMVLQVERERERKKERKKRKT